MTETIKEFFKKKVTYANDLDSDSKFPTDWQAAIMVKDLKQLLELKQKEIDAKITERAKVLGVEDGWKELAFRIMRFELESKAWREFCEALK